MALLAPDADVLSRFAWEKIAEAMSTGQMIRKDGTAVVLGPDHYVRLAQWLATLKKRAPKLVHTEDDFAPPKTSEDS